MATPVTETPLRKITANLPAALLEGAMRNSGLGVTETLRAALEAYHRQCAQNAVRRLRGKVPFQVTSRMLKEERE